jgi:hypothetical protein
MAQLCGHLKVHESGYAQVGMPMGYRLGVPHFGDPAVAYGS